MSEGEFDPMAECKGLGCSSPHVKARFRGLVAAAVFQLALSISLCAFGGEGVLVNAPASEEMLLFQEIPSVYGASRFEQKVTEAPSNVTVINSAQIKKYGYRSLADILQSVGGMFVNYDRNYHYAGIRGVAIPGDYNSRLLVLVDGHRTNDALYDQAPIGLDFPVDVDLIERVEVIRGPGSSIYGTNALLGVVNVITKRGRDYQEISIKSYGELSALVADFNVMVKRLGEYRRQVDGYRKALEEKVEQAGMLAREAAAASRAKSQFLATMSHEIRTPMNGILGMTELLSRTQLDEKQSTLAKTVQSSARSLLAIINDILDFSKIEAGKLQLETTEFNLVEMAESVVEMLYETALHKDLELLCRIADDVPMWVLGDPVRVRQVLTNLLGNALKFTGQGGVTLNVQVVREDVESVLLRFEVRDTGIGIAPDALSTVFDAFSQADGSTTRKYGGTGLGLAICRQLASMMGGEIGAESTLGQGSTFWFTSSLKRSACEATGLMPAPDPAPGSRVLIVDPSPMSRDILVETVRSWGMIVDCAEDGPSALMRLRDAAQRGMSCDIVVIDRYRLARDGIELAREIRMAPELTSVRLVLLGALGREPLSDREAEDLGVAAQLYKPLRKGLFRQCLTELSRGVLKKESASPERAPSTEEVPSPVTGLRVLLAEDNPVNQMVASEMLRSLGADVSVAANGHEVLDTLRGGSFDIILMDCQMPVMDGFECTQLIRNGRAGAGASTSHLPIVALTANAMEGDRERCLASGMDDYLSKPFDLDGLVSVLTRNVSHRLAPSALEA